MTASRPFNTDLPSPIGQLAQLRAPASESVVRDENPTDVQRLMAPAGVLEDALWNRLGDPEAPILLVLTGSAGSGKSATINHLLERERATAAGRIGAHLADATHADSPDQEQAERLAAFFSPFADGAPRPAGPCRLVAMNTGMALRFFHDLDQVDDPPALSGFETILRQRLGLPRTDAEADEWLQDAVLVVNLDHRPTAGEPGDVFDQVLSRLDPSDPDGVLQGAPRCGTCDVREWCWPMANATVLSSEPGRLALNSAAGDVALARGRQLPPRALWNVAAELALSGLDVDRYGGGSSDPCDAIAEIASTRDEDALVQGLACSAALATAREGTLVWDIAERDPGYLPSFKAHELVSDAGLDPDSDAKQLTNWLSAGKDPHPAVKRAAAAISRGHLLAPEEARPWGRVLARAAWLHGYLEVRSGLDSEYAAALGAQNSGASADDPGPDGDALMTALSAIEEGLAGAFGLTSGPERYFPTSTPAPGADADLLVEVKLVDDLLIQTQQDPIITANAAGSGLVGYRPITLSIRADQHAIAVDYPLWRLLRRAASGTAPSTMELERFLSLRQAIRRLGVKAGADPRRPLLVRERHPGGRKFRIVTRSAHKLRATEVL